MVSLSDVSLSRPSGTAGFGDAVADVPARPYRPKGLPLVGVIPQVRRDPLGYFTRLARDHGDAVLFDLGPDPVLMLNHPRLVRHVLQDQHTKYHKSKFYKPLRPVLGNGIFLAEGKDWLAQRRMVAPSFSGVHFERMAERITHATGEMMAGWQARIDRGQSLDIANEMMHLTLDGAMRALLNVELRDGHDEIYDALTVMLDTAERQVWSLLPIARLAKLTPRYRKALATLNSVTYSVIDQRRRAMAAGDPAVEDDLLTQLVRQADQGAIDDPLLRDLVLSIILSGHETTALALGWAWALMSRTPQVAQKLQHEVDTVLQGRTPTFADVKQLTYTRMVFEETMRLYPPVWTLSRTAVEDDVIDGIPVRKGQSVMVCPYAIHRNPRLWDNPEGFDPERFSPAASEGRDRHAFIPFGGGPRVCLGNRFGMMESVLAMAMVTQRYRVQLVPGQDLAPLPMITLRPRHGIHVTLTPRGDRDSAAGCAAAREAA